MNIPEQRSPGGEITSSAAWGQNVYFEPLVYDGAPIQEIDRQLAAAKERHKREQQDRSPRFQSSIHANTWLLMREVLCETFTMTGEQIMERAQRYDEGPYEFDTDQGKLVDHVGATEAESGIRGRRLMEDYHNVYSHLCQTQDEQFAKDAAMMFLRGDVARRTFRLRYLGLLDADTYHQRRIEDMQLVDGGNIVAITAREIWLQLHTASSHSHTGQADQR